MNHLSKGIILHSKNNGHPFATSQEIANQPKTWKRVLQKIQQESNDISSFLNERKGKENLNIILTGAGSSAFIGDVVSSSWTHYLNCTARAVPTTDLVTHFGKYVILDKPLLLISFARSGNSPESTAVVAQANQLCSDIYHLIITCNSDGKLAQMSEQDNSYVFLLPEEAEDQSLAMTNSFTSMALAATLIPKMLSGEEGLEQQIERMSSYGKKIIGEFASMCEKISKIDFKRIIFLGSGPLLGIAEESHLKVQELTNGKVIGKFDSFLGFRHGPKAIINEDSLLVYLLSNDEGTKPYEQDLIEQIAQHQIGLTTLAVTESDCLSSEVDFCINLDNSQKIDESLWAIVCTLPAQIIGFYKSLALGLNPDNPSPDGTISRVVEGVKIYDGHSQEVGK